MRKTLLGREWNFFLVEKGGEPTTLAGPRAQAETRVHSTTTSPGYISTSNDVSFRGSTRLCSIGVGRDHLGAEFAGKRDAKVLCVMQVRVSLHTIPQPHHWIDVASHCLSQSTATEDDNGASPVHVRQMFWLAIVSSLSCNHTGVLWPNQCAVVFRLRTQVCGFWL